MMFGKGSVRISLWIPFAIIVFVRHVNVPDYLPFGILILKVH